jgi:hypothetical protein
LLSDDVTAIHVSIEPCGDQRRYRKNGKLGVKEHAWSFSILLSALY